MGRQVRSGRASAKVRAIAGAVWVLTGLGSGAAAWGQLSGSTWYWIGGYAGNDWFATQIGPQNEFGELSSINPLVVKRSNWANAATTFLSFGVDASTPSSWQMPPVLTSPVEFRPLVGATSAAYFPVLNNAFNKPSMDRMTVAGATSVTFMGTENWIRVNSGLAVGTGTSAGSLTLPRSMFVEATVPNWTASVIGSASLGGLGYDPFSQPVTVTKTGSGTLVLQSTPEAVLGAANLTSPPRFNVSQGTLQLNTAYTTPQANVSAGATLRLSPDVDAPMTLATAVSGAGSVVKGGPGTTTFTGGWTHTGGTTVEQGVLRLGSNGALPTGGTVNVSTGSEFSFAQNGGTVSHSGTLALSGTGSVAFDLGASTTMIFSGPVQGAAGTFIRQRSGYTVVTSGLAGFVQTAFFGNLVVSGGTLEIASSDLAPLGDATVVMEGGTLRAGGAERIFRNNMTLAGGFTYGRLTQHFGPGTATLAADITVTLNNSDGPANGFSTLSNLRETGGSRALTVVAGPNGVGTGGLTLSGTSTHTGGTVVATRVRAGGASLGSGPVSVSATGTLELSGSNTVSDLRGAAGAVVTNVATGNLTLTIGGTNDGTFSGTVIDSPARTLAITRTGTGTTVFTGDSTASGRLTVSSGLVRIGTGGTSGAWLGPITNNGVLEFNRAAGYVYGGTVTGTGSVRLLGGMSLWGNLNHTGGTSVLGSITVANAGRINGPITIGAGQRLSLNNAGVTTWSNSFSGTGTLGVSSAATTTLSGDFSGFTGTIESSGSARAVLSSATIPSISVIGDSRITLTATGLLSVPRLNIADNGRLVIPPGQQGTLRTSLFSVVVSPGGSIDLTDNFAVLQNTSATTVRAFLQLGRISSSLAGTGSGRDVHGRIGFLANLTGFGFRRFATFGGTSVSTTDTLLRYTYLGDTDLNGTLDARDFNAVLNGLTNGRSGWENGDVNYDGVVNMTDWSLFLAAYAFVQSGGAPFGDPTGAAAIPEPATAAALLLTTPLLLRRRRVR